MRTTVLLRRVRTAPLVADARAGLGIHPAPDAPSERACQRSGYRPVVEGGTFTLLSAICCTAPGEPHRQPTASVVGRNVFGPGDVQPEDQSDGSADDDRHHERPGDDGQ